MFELIAMVFRKLDFLGARIIGGVEGFGLFTRFSIQAFRWFFRGLGKWSRSSLLMPQFYQVGTKSIPVVMLTGAFIGMVLVVEAYDQFAAIGQESRLGGIIGVSLVRQIGPVLAAVMLAGRVGGAVSAELGTMRVTEQLDAMRVMGSDPVAYLVVPRVLACVVMIPVLTMFSDLTGIYGGYLVTVRGFGVSSHAYWEFSNRFVGTWDWSTGVIKSMVFGLAIGLISCYKGFYCRPGAAGVGRAATESFVTSFLAIIAINLVMAKFLKDLGYVVLGHGGPTAFSG
ncbi:MAG: ABC transporter permease [Planctomycetota bacterium]|nr:ABC transporter permease [Planctomycetota bacterium]